MGFENPLAAPLSYPGAIDSSATPEKTHKESTPYQVQTISKPNRQAYYPPTVLFTNDPNCNSTTIPTIFVDHNHNTQANIRSLIEREGAAKQALVPVFTYCLITTLFISIPFLIIYLILRYSD